MSNFTYADFQPARPKKRRNNRAGSGAVSPSDLLERTRSELAAESRWVDGYQLLIRGLDASPKEVLCLGLGSPSNSRDARAQLVFLLRLCDDLNLSRAQVTLYDPVFTDQDTQFLGVLLGLNVKTVPIGHALASPTILFMPHCDMTLYESFLRENWSMDRLSLVVLLIANNLCDYAESNPFRKMSENFPCILRLGPYLDSRPLPTSHSHPAAFNNVTIQRPKICSLPSTDSSFWDINERIIELSH